MHRAAHALVEAVLAREDLGVSTVYQPGYGERARIGKLGACLDRSQRGAIHVAFHDIQQALFIELPNGGKTLGQDFAMAAVRAEDEILRLEVKALPDGSRFLPDGQVGWSCVRIAEAAIGAFLFEAVERRLELANQDHVAVDVNELIARVESGLGLRVGDVSVDRNLRRAYG